MKALRVLAFCLCAFALFSCGQQANTTLPDESDPADRPAYALAIHGGAGTILPENMTPDLKAAYLDALNQALDLGEGVLKQGGTSLEAVEKTICFLEDSPLFNAGKGAVFTHEGRNELDASVMDGRDRSAGAVGGIHHIKHPIRAALAVMRHSPHVLLTGKGAEDFAKAQGLDTVPPSYFYTENRWKSLERARAKEQETGMSEPAPDSKFGTVGCVALDSEGNLAAGTSTGGMTNKRWGRLGDSPIIGAGTYADNNTCAVSCTGHGEFFIRYAVAYDIAALMAYKGMSLAEATDMVVQEKLKQAGGNGGLIAVDKHGHISMPFNTPGMYRAYALPGDRAVGLFQEMEEGGSR